MLTFIIEFPSDLLYASANNMSNSNGIHDSVLKFFTWCTFIIIRMGRK